MNFYEKYWSEFNKRFQTYMDENTAFTLKPKKATSRNYLSWSCFGRKGFGLQVSLRKDSDWVAVNFTINLHDEKENFKALLNKKNEIENVIGSKIRWDPLPGEISSTQAVLAKHKLDVTNPLDWKNQHQWLIENLHKFFEAFYPYASKL